MSLWTRHSETGVLLRGRGGLVLERDGGGTWRLDAPSRSAYRLLGHRVRVDGLRVDFDVLSADRVERLQLD